LLSFSSGVGIRFAFVSVFFFLFFILALAGLDASRVHGQLGAGYREWSFTADKNNVSWCFFRFYLS
jgi:hypothetical protein